MSFGFYNLLMDNWWDKQAQEYQDTQAAHAEYIKENTKMTRTDAWKLVRDISCPNTATELISSLEALGLIKFEKKSKKTI